MSGSHGTISSSGGSAIPASRWNASRTCACFCASCAAYARSWKRQPPQAGKCSHGASTRCGPGSNDLGRERLRVGALHLRDARAHAVAGQAAAHEDDEPVEPRDAVAAVGERLDVSSTSSSILTGAAIAGSRRPLRSRLGGPSGTRRRRRRRRDRGAPCPRPGRRQVRRRCRSARRAALSTAPGRYRPTVSYRPLTSGSTIRNQTKTSTIASACPRMIAPMPTPIAP